MGFSRASKYLLQKASKRLKHKIPKVSYGDIKTKRKPDFGIIVVPSPKKKEYVIPKTPKKSGYGWGGP